MTVSFDIETIRSVDDVGDLDLDVRGSLVKDLGDPDAVDSDALDRLGLSFTTARIVVISCWDDYTNTGVCLTNDGLAAAELPPGFVLKAHSTEAELLETFWKICRRQKRFATFNGNGFDVPMLVGRSLVNAVTIHRPLIETKPWEDVHVDLMAKLTNNGATGWKQQPSLERLCVALGVPTPKGDIDGKEVDQAWRDGRRDVVATYCCRDTRALADCVTAWDAANEKPVAAPIATKLPAKPTGETRVERDEEAPRW